ncbi:adenosylmethionine--8-amino-7-oxononanoate transaminase [Marinicella sp. S1101]|uniref:adenosylmethionine--8-amino-7-oxononanoate transaminase n=1 Tax=Marinicella marina TaxID=2996016 RepID=UPI002260EE0C|nr:adenosylmethionine--8-amino-7-oxononanoate transaminase [Marinicella marina]MCX7554079.1 adenosylmethionine--8-amino-7-oxononanoate transaminase [Marinicella marina]MDJ1141228.1 adenosylmethionine--8-amino-7-oxononanoate transaminase [Marinicella marina]
MDVEFDQKHLWHPYTNLNQPTPVQAVDRAEGVYLYLQDGTRVIDAMSSWWCCIHGYNHPVLNQAVTEQLGKMSHVMFGGLTHRPAIELGKKLLEITDESLDAVFFADSGSVAVEVAMKMAAQYCFEQGETEKKQFITFAKGYHGDTFGAMSVCDPVTGMHHKFNKLLNKHIFIDSPQCGFNDAWQDQCLDEFKCVLKQHHDKTIAVIFEPIVQGAGGMNFYSPEYLKEVRHLCDQYDVLLIFDEIATGFGRTGKLFAYEHAAVVPDILCLGKALTGGYMTLSAVLCNQKVAKGISTNFMHGPTFMANPLACAVALASINLLLESNWQARIESMAKQMTSELGELIGLPHVKDVRVLGAIAVVELFSDNNCDWQAFQSQTAAEGVWVRPFMNMIYIMPPFIIEPSELTHITKTLTKIIKRLPC